LPNSFFQPEPLNSDPGIAIIFILLYSLIPSPTTSIRLPGHSTWDYPRLLTRPDFSSPEYQIIQLSNHPSNKSSKHQITQAPNNTASNNTTANNIASNNPGIKLPTHQLTQGLNFKVCILTNFSSG